MVENTNESLTLTYDKNIMYAFTLNPLNTHQYFHKTDRLHKFINFINEQFLHYKQIGISYRFNCELSEPIGDINPNNNGSRLHIHGRFFFRSKKTVLRFLLLELSKLLDIGKLHIKTCKDILAWDNYCEKQQHIMQIPTFTNMEKG